MNSLANGVGAFILMGVLASLFLGVFDNFQEVSGFTETDLHYNNVTNSSGNILEAINNLNLVTEMQAMSSKILTIGNPDSTWYDIVGGLASLAIGALKTIVSIVTTPFEVGYIILEYYELPPIIMTGIAVLFSTYVAFILLSAYLKYKV